MHNKNGPWLVHDILAKINALSHQQWPSLLVPQYQNRSMRKLQQPPQNSSPSMWKMARQLKQQLKFLPRIGQQSLFQQIAQSYQHIQNIRQSIKQLTQYIQTTEPIPIDTKKQLINRIVPPAKQWIFRVSAHYRQMFKEDRWNIFIMFDPTTKAPKIHIALAPQQLFSIKSTPNQMIYLLSILYSIIQSGCHLDPETFMPSEEMFQKFIKTYPPIQTHYPKNNPFKIHAPLVDYMYILIFSHIHNFGIKSGVTLCYQMLTKWKEYIVQFADATHHGTLAKKLAFMPTIIDLSYIVCYDNILPMPPWAFCLERRRSFTRTLYDLTAENFCAKILKDARYEHFSAYNGMIQSQQKESVISSGKDKDMQLINQLHQNNRRAAHRNGKLRDDRLLNFAIAKATCIAITEEENCLHAEGIFEFYMQKMTQNVQQQLYIDHFYYEVFHCLNFKPMLDLHDWNMRSAQDASLNMHFHNKQQLHHFRNKKSELIILGLHRTGVNLIEFQKVVYERYEQSAYPNKATSIHASLINYLQSRTLHTISSMSSLISLTEGLLHNLKELFDAIDPDNEMFTEDFFNNFFSADFFTCNELDSWYL